MAKREFSSLAWIYWLAFFLVALPALGIGAWLAARSGSWAMLAAGTVSTVGILIGWPFLRALEGTRDATCEQFDELMTPFQERMQEFSMLLNQISEQQLLSDRGKSVAFREKDREALRRAIHEEINNKDWEAALALAVDMERVFGYRHEAETFRLDIESRRSEVVRKQVADSIALLERFCRDENWQDAKQEAERTAKLYPNDEQARELPRQIETRRQNQKRQLLESLHEAQQRNDIEGGWEILKRLDLYLTPTEAVTIQEDARAIIRAKLHNLGELFKAAVHEQRNQEAISIGETIIQEFPNARMAQEVREYIPKLQQRATEPASVPA